VIGHDALRDRESEAGALSRRLGREERMEDAGEVLLGDPGALVLELDLDRAVAHPRTDRQGTPSLHRLQRVGREPEAHLPQLALVHRDRRQCGVEVDRHMAGGEA
jgi:hypothetical protein